MGDTGPRERARCGCSGYGLHMILAVVIVLVLLSVSAAVGVALLSRRRSDVVSEIDRFSRARDMTTAWSREGWTGPPRSPDEADDAAGGSPQRPEPEPGAHD